MEGRGLLQMMSLSVRDPAEAARRLIALDLDRSTLWTALVLVAVINTLLQAVVLLLVPPPPPLGGLFASPLVSASLLLGWMVLSVYAILWAGRSLGGTARLEDVMTVLVWLHLLWAVVRVGVLVLLVMAPMLSTLFILGATALGLWILVHFVDQAHHLNSPAKAVGVLIAAFVGIVLGLSLAVSLLGLNLPGVGDV